MEECKGECINTYGGCNGCTDKEPKESEYKLKDIIIRHGFEFKVMVSKIRERASSKLDKKGNIIPGSLGGQKVVIAKLKDISHDLNLGLKFGYFQSKNFIGKAICNTTDPFNYNVGVNLAIRRCVALFLGDLKVKVQKQFERVCGFAEQIENSFHLHEGPTEEQREQINKLLVQVESGGESKPS